MAADPRRVQELFIAALKLAEGPERQAFLDRECAGDAELRCCVLALLYVHDQPQPAPGTNFSAPLTDKASPRPDFLESSTSTPANIVEEQAGAVLADRYKLLERIGKGGMGSVWMAQQIEPVKRTVAIKLIRAGADSKAVLARFEAERQALALMDHPNIARVLDAGTTERGSPFFVMELVKGVPITKFCDAHKLTPRQRLELFIQVCQAIQHAHQKGIIHRDIKPSNVLVALYDDRPVPKVIDFGVAKATGSQLTEATLHTGFGAIIGTPQYMSPEQATLNNLDIDTRSDIYSLGVLLYELLAGSPPFRRQELEQAGMLEILRVIREEDPPKPSTKVSSADALPSLAVNRGMEPTRLTRLLRGDIDWIVMKALEKERSRRYETANGFALDIQRYLADEPVQAGPPTTAYRLRKFIKRNKVQVLAASLVLLALLLGMAGTTGGLVLAEGKRRDAVKAQFAEAERAEGERLAKEEAQKAAEAERLAKLDAQKSAEAEKLAKLDAQKAAEAEKQAKLEAQQAAAAEKLAKMEADKAAQAERQAKEQAEKRLKQNEKLIEIVTSVFHNLDPKSEEKEGESLRVLLGKHLEEAVKQLDGEAVGNPVVVARLQCRLGESLQELGHYDQAEIVLTKARRTLEAALGAEHPDTLTSKSNLALLYGSQGKYRQAETLYQEVIEVCTAKLGADHPSTLTTKNNLALLFQSQAKYPEAEKLFKEVLEAQIAKLGADHPSALATKHNLAMLYKSQGKYPQAETLYKEVLEARIAKLGADHLDTLATMNNLAIIYKSQGKFPQAEALYKKVVEVFTTKLGADHPSTLNTKHSLALVYLYQGQYAPAETLLKEVLDIQNAKLGAKHSSTLVTKNSLAGLYHSQGQLAPAEVLYKEVLEGLIANLGPDHPDTLSTKNNLAGLYHSQEKLAPAETLYKEVVKGLSAKLGANHPDTLTAKHNLAAVYMDQRKFEPAETLYKEVLEGRSSKLGADHPDTLSTENALAVLYWSMKKFDLSMPLFEDVVQQRKKKLGPNHPWTLLALANLGSNYRDADRLEEGIRCLEEAVAGFRKLSDPKPAQLAWIPHALAQTYDQAKQHAKAEPLYREFYEQGRKQFGDDDPRTAGLMAQLALNLLNQKKHADAEKLLRDCLAIRDKKQPEEWGTFNTRSMLGAALLGQKKYTDAEPLLKDGYEGLKKRQDKIPEQVRKIRQLEALERLVQLYEATNNKDEAAKWRKELDAVKDTAKQP